MRPIWKTRTLSGIFHAMIAWGFVFYLLVNMGDIIQGYWPGRFLGESTLSGVYRWLADVFSVLVITGMIWFLARRFLWQRTRTLGFNKNILLLPDVRSGVHRDSLLVGLFILCHVGFRFLGETITLRLEYLETGSTDTFQPFAATLSPLWTGLEESSLVLGQHLCWWIALGLILCFVPYFPYTKHFHFIMAGFNFWTRPERSSLGALDPIDLEDETADTFGALTIEHLPQTSLVDAFACIMCNRCQDVCPAYVTGKELSPAALEVNKRYYLNQHMELLASGASSKDNLLDFAITESALWACTACGACVDICPVGNEPMFDILDIRRGQVLMENNFPSAFEDVYRGMERNNNPWNIGSAQRMAWAKDLNVPTLEQNPDASLLWWVGCAPSYDPHAQRTARALARILHAANVSFAVLGQREHCTGDVARRSGNEYLFQELAHTNINTLNNIQPRRIVTTCPHCLHTLGNEYSALGGQYQVLHHTELLYELVDNGTIQLKKEAQKIIATFHDPCYLGRHNGITQAPRKMLNALPLHTIEMSQHGTQSFCCGAGGGQMWKEEEPGNMSVGHARYREAVNTGADTLATGCPFCLTMLKDASQSDRQPLTIRDVAELVADNLDCS